MKEKDLTLKKARNRQYSAEVTSDTDYAADLVLPANTSVQVKCLLHSLEQAARGIGLCVNSDKTQFMYFNQDNKPRKKISHSPTCLSFVSWYLGSNISSTESNVNIGWQP